MISARPDAGRAARAIALAILAVSLPALAVQPLVRDGALRFAKGALAARADAPRARLDLVRAPGAASPGVARELEALGWEALVDPSGLPLRIWGPPIAFDVPAPANGALAFLTARPALLGFRAGEEGYELSARPAVRAGKLDVVVLDQRWYGYPIEGVRADLRLRDGEVVMARLHLARGIDAARTPSITGEDALESANRALAEAGWTPRAPPRVDADRPLAIVRHGDAWALAWAVRAESVAPPGRLTVWVDALDGAAIAVRDEVRRGTATDTPLSLKVSHEPRRAGDAEIVSALPFFDASDAGQSFVSDTAGAIVVPVIGANRILDLGLRGPFVDVAFWEGTSAAAVQVTSGIPAEFVWEGLSASLSERDAAISHAVVRTRMKRMAPDLAWLDESIRILTEIPDSDGCNAFWTGSEAQFYAESAECNATARVADVVYHEIGHGLHQNLAVGGNPPGDVGEGSADYLAATITGDPDIGPSFFKDKPEGIRNLEPDLVFPDDVTDEPHEDGLIWGGAFWDLRTRLVALLGTDEGIFLADRIFADTLRFNPVMEDGFWDALLAADDDGNVSNGGPVECEVVAAFAAHGLGPGDGLAIDHAPLGLQPPGAAGYRVRAHVASAFPRCGGSGVQSAELQWRRVGETAWQTLNMGADLVPGWRTATIPAQAEGTGIEYRMTATDAGGGLATAPARSFDLFPFHFPIGRAEVVFEDDFETDKGWTHELVEGQDILGADDWQRGPPLGRSGDPSRAFSGTNVWGNDLGADPFNGAYQPNVRNRLESPVIDCRRCAGTRLQFRRWLGVEGSSSDIASVWIGDERVWTNPAGERLRDQEWRFEYLNVSQVADGKEFRLRFEMKTNAGIQLGGWNLDDVRVTRDGEYAGAGACSCSFGGRSAPVASTALALAILVIVLGRRVLAWGVL